ncbi:CPBP family intramembrane metalloprotease [Candidatus Chlorohelix allophototropha]|uniref:CPBP family intramembrane metalloprotease n=2 Tax=Candidatus Chlorohelix allophototropha TaxID=3003348 RepID=A0ABY9B7V0_9CHLR|nr:CPBP family intramembrane metalloprotease [Chloroflexota bacterium L227-S17]
MSKMKLAAGLATGLAGGVGLYKLLKSKKLFSMPGKKTSNPIEENLLSDVKPGVLTKVNDELQLATESVKTALQLSLLLKASASEVAAGSIVNQNKSADKRLKMVGGLVGAIWASGAIGHFTKLKEWPALFLYVFGSFGLAAYLGKKQNGWKDIYITKDNIGKATALGLIGGSILFISDVGNTYVYYKRGGAVMEEMENILVKQKMMYLFPVLIFAEEFLWRGIMISALKDKKVSTGKSLMLTTLPYALNHFFVAPVSFKERALMAGPMAIPIGFIAGYLTNKTKNTWTGVIIHMMTMFSMLLDVFVIPKMVKKDKAA